MKYIATQTKFVAYYRVSTAKQERSGLGLEAQQAAVLHHTQDGLLLAQYTETESGKNDNRPELQAALDHAELTGAVLVVAKLDRLSRNADVLLKLSRSGVVDVQCCDMDFANKQMLGVMALLAEWEREQISARTKAALQAAKARGRTLGGNRGNLPRVSAVGRQRSMEKRQERAAKRNAKVAPHIAAARAAGHSTLRAIAGYLNERHITAPRGGCWQAATVARVIG